MGNDPVRRMVYLAGMLPAIWYFCLALTGRLGIDPQNVLERALGLWALRFLILALVISPLRRFGGLSLLRYRRVIGLLTFYYASLHLAVYIALDRGIELADITTDIIRRPYITLGMSAFVILVPLAITSSNAMILRLGAIHWKNLHRLVYVATIASVLHFVLVGKVWYPEHLIYGALSVLLLGLRLVPYRRGTATRSAVQPPRI